MLFLKSLDCLVILFEFIELLFEFAASVVEAALQVKHLQAHLFDHSLVLVLKFLLLLRNLVLVALEGRLRVVALIGMSFFKLTDFFLPTGAILGLFKSLFLLGNN